MAEQQFGPHTPIVPVASTTAPAGNASQLVGTQLTIDPISGLPIGDAADAAYNPPGALTATNLPAALAQTGGGVSSPPAANPPAPPSAEDTALKSASAQINAFLQSVPGLASLDPNNQLGQWMNSQTSTLYGQGITDPTAILNTLQTTMNNPNNDPAAKAVFDQLFPGYNEKIQNGTSNSNGQYTGIAGYIAYANQLKQFASVADLTPNTLNAQAIGDLWANDVSSSEVSSRITQGYQAASNAWNNIAGFGDYMSQNFGMTQGGLASYYLNPENAISDLTMQQQINQGLTAGESKVSGFGSLSQSQAASLSAFLAGSNTNGLGNNPALTAGQANSFFTSNLEGSTSGQVTGTLSQLAGLESATPGQPNAVVTADQLIAAGEGSAQDINAVSRAQQTRTAGSRGGGGAATTANGAEGLGFAQS